MICKTGTARFGNINNDKPIKRDDQPMSVINNFQFGSQTLWNNIFINPTIIATNAEIIKNFSSWRSLKICFIRFGFKLSIKKKMSRYQPQNFAKKSYVSIVFLIIHVIPKMVFLYYNLFVLL